MDDRDKTNPRIRGTTPEVEQAARDLRRRLTPAEAVLWEALRLRRLGGLRFRRQHPVGRFILGFYCPGCRLVVELDGESHLDPDQRTHDASRTEILNQYGYRVIRFPNAAVFDDLEGVLARIEVAARRTDGQTEQAE